MEGLREGLCQQALSSLLMVLTLGEVEAGTLVENDVEGGKEEEEFEVGRQREVVGGRVSGFRQGQRGGRGRVRRNRP
jgi:hypothetical protein